MVTAKVMTMMRGKKSGGSERKVVIAALSAFVEGTLLFCRRVGAKSFGGLSALGV